MDAVILGRKILMWAQLALGFAAVVGVKGHFTDLMNLLKIHCKLLRVCASFFGGAKSPLASQRHLSL